MAINRKDRESTRKGVQAAAAADLGTKIDVDDVNVTTCRNQHNKREDT